MNPDRVFAALAAAVVPTGLILYALGALGLLALRKSRKPDSRNRPDKRPSRED